MFLPEVIFLSTAVASFYLIIPGIAMWWKWLALFLACTRLFILKAEQGRPSCHFPSCFMEHTRIPSDLYTSALAVHHTVLIFSIASKNTYLSKQFLGKKPVEGKFVIFHTRSAFAQPLTFSFRHGTNEYETRGTSVPDLD